MSRSVKFLIMLSFVSIFILSIFPGVSAFAHSSLVRTLPEGGAKLETSPSTIEFWFKDPVVLHSKALKVIDSSGRSFQLDNSYLDPNNQTHIIGELKEPLPANRYNIEINVIALDGDIITEKFFFEVLKDEPKQKGPLKLSKQIPNDGQIIKGSPDKIDLWFNQETKLTAIGVFDKNQQPVKLKEPYQDPVDPTHITVEFDQLLAKGTYQVTWYAHPSKKDSSNQPDNLDVFYFAVDEFTPIEEGSKGTPVKKVWFPDMGLKQLGYWLIFIGLSILFGSSLFIQIISKNLKQNSKCKFISLGFIFITMAGVTLLILQQRLELLDLPLSEFFTLKFILIPIIQVILLLLGLMVRRIETFAFGLALFMTPFVMGHASYPRYGGYFTIFVNELHLFGASIWMGGLLALITLVKKNEVSDFIGKSALKFSRLAFWSLIVIIFSGIIMTIRYIPSFSIESFLDSQWGKAVIVKAVLTILVVLVGYLQRRTIKSFTVNMVNKFKIRGINEIVYGTLILLFASILVVSTPSAAEQGIYPEGEEYEQDLDVEMSPLNPGLNVLTIDLKEKSDIEDIRVKITMPPDYSVEYDAFEIDEDTFKITGNIIHAAGTLFMEVEAIKENGDSNTYQYTIVVPGEVRFNE
ncbi:copper resistance CopC/CopD family protein [Metabacillus endolithicus]|uniref:Copper resistance CopC/CopD family protein n=1 Tax=Metabacillus endolithicus TaxID=1535204 RepID=A0ABW5C288_9BACI|nr:copper resistance protein CopC [Metabacillus endolithicus]UPG66154.1 copper resistance protein CopC [Metabacillus endolithicus]